MGNPTWFPGNFSDGVASISAAANSQASPERDCAAAEVPVLEDTVRPWWQKRVLWVAAGLVVFILLFMVAIRITVTEMFRGIEQSRATGLAAVSPWEPLPMLQKSAVPADYAMSGLQISRSADLRMRSDAFDHSVATLKQIVTAHHGYLEDLRTESRSGRGRALAALVTVPSNEFDPTVSGLKTLGRIEALSEAGEDSAVKLATAERHLAAAQTTLARLQKLQREQKGQLRDALEVEKEIAQADSAVREAARQHENLLSTIAQAHIQLTLLEDFRAPFEAHFAEASLRLRNSLIDGVGGIFQSVALVVGVILEYGLPLLFWGAILAWPGLLLWRCFRPRPTAPLAAPGI